MKPEDFIKEFCDEHFPSEYGMWIGFDDHDPQFTKKELSNMERKGIIDIDMKNNRYRLTMKATKLKGLSECL